MYGNLYIQDASGNKILVRGIQTLAGKRFDSTGIKGLTDIAVGDEIVVYGTAQLYNGEAQVNGHVILAVWRNTKYLTSDALLDYVAPAESVITDLTLNGLAMWSTSNSDVIAISGTTGTVTRGATDVTVTLTATIVDPYTGEDRSKSYDVVVKAAAPETTKVATFDLGTNGAACEPGKESDGTGITDTTGTISKVDGNYTLNIVNPTKVYDNAGDPSGNGCIKLGTSKVAGSFTIDITGQDVKKIVIYVGKYKTYNDALTAIAKNGDTNGAEIARNVISKYSGNSEYDAFEIELTSDITKVFFSTEGAARCKIDKIEFYA